MKEVACLIKATLIAVILANFGLEGTYPRPTKIIEKVNVCEEPFPPMPEYRENETTTTGKLICII